MPLIEWQNDRIASLSLHCPIAAPRSLTPTAMKRTDARKPESGHASRSNQPFFDAKAATAFFASDQSVQRNPFFQRPASTSVPIQAKLTVGAVGDKYEQEADRVASSVVDQINRPAGPQGGDQPAAQRLGGEEEVQMQRSPDALQRVEQEEELQMKPIADTIQRMGPAEEEELQMKPDWLQRETDPEEEDELQMKPMPETIQRKGMEEDELQMKGAIAPQVTTQGGDVSSNLEASIQQARGGGQAIAENVRTPLEQAFGADFSGVRVHTDSRSNQLNQSIQAKAFTTGQDVFFRQGAYEPGSRSGQELIAHELTHVVQQGGEVVQAKKGMSSLSSNCIADSVIQPMRGKDGTHLPNLHQLNEALRKLSPEITGISLDMLETSGANLNLLNIAIDRSPAQLYDSMKRREVLDLLKLPLANLVNTHAATYIYDTHGDKHFPGGPAGTKFTAGRATVNPLLENLIIPEIGRIRRNAKGRDQSYYLTTGGNAHSGRSDITIQVDFTFSSDTVTYHGYPDSGVTRYVLSRTKNGEPIGL